MKRTTTVLPGYDCRVKPCGKNGCGTRAGYSHGCDSDQWIYAVADDDIALVLQVSSGIVGGAEIPRGEYLTLHTAWPTDRDAVRESVKPMPCEWLPAGCFQVSSAAAADVFVKAHPNMAADLRPEQPETFWLDLERLCDRYGAEASAKRADIRWVRCPQCNGEGTVRRTYVPAYAGTERFAQVASFERSG